MCEKQCPICIMTARMMETSEQLNSLDSMRETRTGTHNQWSNGQERHRQADLFPSVPGTMTLRGWRLAVNGEVSEPSILHHSP